MGIKEKLFGPGKSAQTTTECLNIYPKDMGGVKYEHMDTEKLDSKVDRWRKFENGQYYPVHVWDMETKGLVPYFPLPEVVVVSPDRLARMLSCPYLKLKAMKMGIWAQIATWMPFAALGLAMLALLIVGGD